MRLVLVFVLCALWCFSGARGSRWYVSPSGTDNGDGSPQSPFANFTRAVQACANGDTVVALPGTYVGGTKTGNGGINLDKFSFTHIHFETDGTLGGDVVIDFGLEGGDSEDPFLSCKTTGANLLVRITNYTFQNYDTTGRGNAPESMIDFENIHHFYLTNCSFLNNRFANGRCILLHNCAKFQEITGCTFEDNLSAKEGAAIAFTGNPNGCNVTDTVFRNNVVTGGLAKGGAIYSDAINYVHDNMQFTNCLFTKNSAAKGGAFYGVNIQNAAKFAFEDCTFTQNHATTVGGAAVLQGTNITNTKFIENKSDKHGGALEMSEEYMENWVQGCLFDSNSALNGSAIRFSDGFIQLNDEKATNLHSSTFINNVAVATDEEDSHGAVYVNSGHVIFTQLLFQNNSATNGGAIVRSPNLITITNFRVTSCNFTENKATADGGAIYFQNFLDGSGLQHNTFLSNTAGGSGGAVRLQGLANVAYNHFIGNKATDGGGMSIRKGVSTELVGNHFESNTATSVGGGLHLKEDTGGGMFFCKFIDNHAGKGGGVGIEVMKMPGLFEECEFDSNTAAEGNHLYISEPAYSTSLADSETFMQNTFVGEDLPSFDIITGVTVIFKRTCSMPSIASHPSVTEGIAYIGLCGCNEPEGTTMRGLVMDKSNIYFQTDRNITFTGFVNLTDGNMLGVNNVTCDLLQKHINLDAKNVENVYFTFDTYKDKGFISDHVHVYAASLANKGHLVLENGVVTMHNTNNKSNFINKGNFSISQATLFVDNGAVDLLNQGVLTLREKAKIEGTVHNKGTLRALYQEHDDELVANVTTVDAHGTFLVEFGNPGVITKKNSILALGWESYSHSFTTGFEEGTSDLIGLKFSYEPYGLYVTHGTDGAPVWPWIFLALFIGAAIIVGLYLHQKGYTKRFFTTTSEDVEYGTL